MATEWEQVNQEVLDMAERLIERHHEHLQQARIGFLFRSEAPSSNGKATLGKAEKVNSKWTPLLQEELDFAIWLAADYWFDVLDPRQKRALLDHELCHCIGRPYEWKIRPHDVEEFAEVVQRHGMWSSDLKRFDQAVNQMLLPIGDGTNGRVVAVGGAGIRSAREIDQIVKESDKQFNELAEKHGVPLRFHDGKLDDISDEELMGIPFDAGEPVNE